MSTPDPFAAAVAPLERDRSREVQQATARQKTLDADRAATSAEEEKTLAPLEKKESAAIADAAAVKPPEQTALPDYKPKPIDPKEYQTFSWGLIGMALIGGAVSKGNWLGVNASLNGALKGFMTGHQMQADQDFKEYETQFKKALAHDQQAQKEFENILQSKTLTINQIKAQIQIAAAKYGREDVRQAAQQNSIDGIWKQVEATDRSLSTLELQHEKMKAQVEAAKPPPNSQGAIGMVLTGMPMNQVVPGYGKAASAQRSQLRDAAIEQIKSEHPEMSLEQAGQELARRSVEFTAGKTSTTQLTKMLGATRQAAAQLDFNIDKTTEEMKKLGSSDISPVINAIARGEEKWTGDPAYSGLFYFMTASATESARLLSGGQASAAQLHQGAAEEAKQWANVNMTPAMWQEVAESMKSEGRERLKTYEDAISAGQGNFGASGAAPPAANVVDWSTLK